MPDGRPSGSRRGIAFQRRAGAHDGGIWQRGDRARRRHRGGLGRACVHGSDCVVACAITSLAPLWQAARTLPNDVLSEGVRASAGARSRRVSRAFVIAEVALAFVLLSVSSVLIAELYRLTRVSPGFNTNHLLTFQLAFAPEGIPGKPSQHAYQTRLLEAVQAVPGVSGAGIVNQIPLNGCCFSTAIFQEGASARPSTGERVAFLPVNPEYFRTMGIPLRRGRCLQSVTTARNC